MPLPSDATGNLRSRLETPAVAVAPHNTVEFLGCVRFTKELDLLIVIKENYCLFAQIIWLIRQAKNILVYSTIRLQLTYFYHSIVIFSYEYELHI
jgi:hypothetical protein